MTLPFEKKDNEFIAWYPNKLSAACAKQVWKPKEAAYYVHIPFCTAICDYCGFAVARHTKDAVPKYIEALRAEISHYAETGRLSNYKFTCGHFGGGTPSVLEEKVLIGIVNLINSSFQVSAEAELTVEVNPISFDTAKSEAYRRGGINRISIGVQSFHEHLLKVLGRPHRSADISQAVHAAQKGPFENYSLDIIFGIPGQTLSELRDDLDMAAATGAPHITCFRLEIIPFTALKLREGAGLLPKRLSQQTLDEMDEVVSSVLWGHGYINYGAFNFAKPGFESIHNAIAFGAPQREYVGFGNSSYSYCNGYVYCNQADPDLYQAQVLAGEDPIAFAAPVTATELMARFFVLGLKMLSVDRGSFVSLFGITPESRFGKELDLLISCGALARDGDNYVVTPCGQKYINNVCKVFYTEANRGQSQHVQFVPQITPKQIEYFVSIAAQKRNSSEEFVATQGGNIA